MANASKLSSGAWRTLATKTINGKKVRKSFTVSPDECGGDSKKAKTLSEKNAREWVLNTETDQIFTTVGTAIDLYIKDRSSVLSPSTIADYERMPKHFSDLLPLDVNDVDSKTIQATINEMAMNKLNARTIKNRIFLSDINVHFLPLCVFQYLSAIHLLFLSGCLLLAHLQSISHVRWSIVL